MIKSILPNPKLKDIIKEFYLISIKNKDETKNIPIVDDCCHDIIFYKQAKAELLYGEKENVENIECHLFTILGLTPPYVLKYKDELTFFTIKFQPWMNNFFFGHIEETGIVNLDQQYSELKSILNQAENEDKIENVLKNINQYFIDQVIELSPKVEMVKSVCEFIADSKGMVQVKDVCAHYNRSRQYINKVFKAEVICSLKTFMTPVRIVSLVKQKSKSEELSLTTLAYDYGYFDQAHFINDFKKVCGVTPSQYFGDLPDFILRHD